MMTKIRLSITVSLLLLSLTACPTAQDTANNITNDNKNVVNVNIDEKLLEAIRGKTGSKEPNETPSEIPPPKKPLELPDTDPDLELNHESERIIFQVIDDNANALNAQDIDPFIDTLHPESEFMSVMPDLFYYLIQAQTRYNILDKSVQSLSESSASVLVLRRTSDLSGTIDQEILYTMRKSGDDWRIYFMTDQTSF